MCKPILILACALLLINTVHGQNTVPDSNVVAENTAIAFFDKTINEQSRLYNGMEYDPYTAEFVGNAYFGNELTYRPCTVEFDGYTYNNVPVKYDIFKDVLVTTYPNGGITYFLASERVKKFVLNKIVFKYIAKDTLRKGPGSGFYHVLYQGPVSALAKYSKTLQSKTEGNRLYKYFTDTKKEYFIERGSDILAVSNKAELLKLLQDHKKELQQYIKVNNISYKDDPEEALTSIVSYYNHLKN